MRNGETERQQPTVADSQPSPEPGPGTPGKFSGSTPHHGTPMLHVQVRVHDRSCRLELETTCPFALREPHLEHSARMPSSREPGRIEGHRDRFRMWLRIPLPSLSKPHGMPRQGEHNPSYEGLGEGRVQCRGEPPPSNEAGSRQREADDERHLLATKSTCTSGHISARRSEKSRAASRTRSGATEVSSTT